MFSLASKRSDLRHLLVSGSVFLFPATVVIADQIASAVFFLLAIIGIPLTIKSENTRLLTKELKQVAIVLLLFFLIALASHLMNDSPSLGEQKLGRYARFLLLIPISLALIKYNPSPTYFWFGITTGGCGAGLVAIFQTWFSSTGNELATGSTHHILFGDLSLALAVIGAVGAIQFRSNFFNLRWFLATSVAFGIIASILSGARGSWIAFPILSFIILHYTCARLGLSRQLWIAAALVLLAILVYLIPQTGVSKRVELALTGVTADTNSGYRLELWKAGWLMFNEKPLLGVGPGGFQSAAKALIESGKVEAYTANHNHPHSEYLNALATRGTLGIVFLLLLFIFPLQFFIRHVKQESDVTVYPLAGILLVASYMHFALTEAILDRALPITFFTFFLAIFLSYPIAVPFTNKEMVR